MKEPFLSYTSEFLDDEDFFTSSVMFTPAPSQTSDLMSEEDKLSDFLSASQVGTIMSRTGFIKDPDYVPSNKTDSQLSDYFSDENSSDSLVFSCNLHSLSFDTMLTSLKNTNCHTTQLMGELNVAFARKHIQQSICGAIIFKVIT